MNHVDDSSGSTSQRKRQESDRYTTSHQHGRDPMRIQVHATWGLSQDVLQLSQDFAWSSAGQILPSHRTTSNGKKKGNMTSGKKRFEDGRLCCYTFEHLHTFFLNAEN
ncbi:hypothetical protein N7G274_009504 [Stereocaulon virgatum]|uniref:Uncharacterized protein n=1 Tax=Stereocaulon virgatum TaxID=373712 RepID=A0ABR3ZX79_9LECA